MMNAPYTPSLRDQIIQLVNSHPNGMKTRDLLTALKNVEYRTLLRHLNKLIDEEACYKKGRGRATKYYPMDTLELQNTPQLSTVSQQLQKIVNQPLQKRKPVHFERPFLERYTPNQSYYLSTTERQHLSQLGTYPDDDQPAGTYTRKILDRFLIDLTWNSSRLEGNTYSLLETENLVHQGAISENKTPTETQMILNHKAAIEFLVQSSDNLELNVFTICSLHALLSDNLLGDPSACGRIRTIPVGISRSSYQPLSIPQQIEDMLRIILEKASKILDPYEQSFFLMTQLPYLQAFEDVNKRVSRLSANIPFIKQNCCPISFIEVDKTLYIEGNLAVYELNKIDLLKDIFIWAYERSVQRYSLVQKILKTPDPFRMQYRKEIYNLVNQIVKQSYLKIDAVKLIQNYSHEYVDASKQAKFVEVIETELMSLHIGNIARYQLSPNEFNAWRKHW